MVIMYRTTKDHLLGQVIIHYINNILKKRNMSFHKLYLAMTQQKLMDRVGHRLTLNLYPIDYEVSMKHIITN